MILPHTQPIFMTLRYLRHLPGYFVEWPSPWLNLLFSHYYEFVGRTLWRDGVASGIMPELQGAHLFQGW